jgi:hypothetical protein
MWGQRKPASYDTVVLDLRRGELDLAGALERVAAAEAMVRGREYLAAFPGTAVSPDDFAA